MTSTAKYTTLRGLRRSLLQKTAYAKEITWFTRNKKRLANFIAKAVFPPPKTRQERLAYSELKFSLGLLWDIIEILLMAWPGRRAAISSLRAIVYKDGPPQAVLLDALEALRQVEFGARAHSAEFQAFLDEVIGFAGEEIGKR